MSYPIAAGGLAAVLAHPDDESFGCAGALALAHSAGATTRLLVVWCWPAKVMKRARHANCMKRWVSVTCC